MDLFEILFILLFILFPIMDQVLKKGRTKGPEPPEEREVPEGEVEVPSHERRPDRAEEMVPDDLWAILTGEKRPAEEMEERLPTTATEEANRPPWSTAEEQADQEEPEPWRAEPEAWAAEEEPAAPEPVSLEYGGGEAEPLERLDYRPVSLEKPLPAPDVRHREFRAPIDRPPRRRRRRSPISKALAEPESVRQAFVLSEVLGTPRGLE